MVANKGYDSRDAQSRMRLIDAASDLLATEGHPSFSARRIGEHADLKPQLVHYYFRSMEELVVAVFHRAAARYFQLHDQALSSPNPIRELWRLNSNLPVARLMIEFVALGKRYPLLRGEMKKSGQNFRELQIEAISRIYHERGIDDPMLTPAALAMLLSAVARGFVIEDNVGVSIAHGELRAYIDHLLDGLDPA